MFSRPSGFFCVCSAFSVHAVLHQQEFGFRAASPQAAQRWSWVTKEATGTSDFSQEQEPKPGLCKVRVVATASLHGAGWALGAAAHRGAHGFGRNQVQVLIVGDLIQTIAILQQLPA